MIELCIKEQAANKYGGDGMVFNKLFRAFFGSLQWKLFIFFLLLSILPAILLGEFLYSNVYKAIEEKTGLYSEQIMVQSAGRLDALLSGIEDISLQIVSARETQQLVGTLSETDDYEIKKDSVTKIENFLGQILSSRREIVGAQILLTNEDMFISAGEKLIPDDYLLSDEYVKVMGNSEPVYWRGTIRNTNPSILYEYVTTLTRKIYHPTNGTILGMLVLSTKEFALADTFSYIDIGPNGFVFIMDQEGKVVSHLSKKTLTKPAEYAFVPNIINSTEDDKRIFIGMLDDEQFMITYAKSKATGWYVVSAIPYSYLMERIVYIEKISNRIEFILILVAIVVALLISTGFTRPIKRLVNAMRVVEKGDLSVYVDVKSSNEISILGNSFNRMLKRINMLIDRVYEAEILQKEAEIHALQSQINPHFLYNTLSVIDSIATLKQEKEISFITQTLADIFRYSTNGNDIATIEDEINHLQHYLNIQRYRYGEGLTWSFIIDPSIKECKIAKLLIQPIVENAVNHGLQKSGTIKVIALRKEDFISITIEDNGKGMHKETLDHLYVQFDQANRIQRKTDGKTHIGLSNVFHRIRNLYGHKYGLTIVSEAGLGTKVKITIPIIK